jgi:hypothetical protein
LSLLPEGDAQDLLSDTETQTLLTNSYQILAS